VILFFEQFSSGIPFGILRSIRRSVTNVTTGNSTAQRIEQPPVMLAATMGAYADARISSAAAATAAWTTRSATWTPAL
jgi:hypothetical protein